MAGSGSIARVDQDSLKQQFTATDLIGKEVYDNAGKKVGEVKDLVLGSAAGAHLAMAFASGKSDSDANRSGSSSAAGRTTSGATSGTSGTGSTYGATGSSTTGSSGTAGTGSAGTSGSTATERMAGTTGSTGTSRTTGSSTLGSSLGSAFNTMSGMASEPAAIVSLGGFMGMGDNLIRVPLSQLNYDSSNERLTLALSETELTSLTDPSKSQNAAE